MPLSKINYTGNGSLADYTYNLGYILQAHVLVKVDDVLQVDPTDYSWINSNTIRFVTVPANLTDILLERSTSQSTRLTSYTNASVLTDDDLNKDSLQAFYLAQEAIDEFANALQINDDTLLWDALTKRITNGATPVDPNDLTTKTYVDLATTVAGNMPTGDPANNFLVSNATSYVTNTPADARTAMGVAIGDGLESSGASIQVDLDGTTITRGAAGIKVSDNQLPLRGHIDGLVMSHDTDTDHDINVTAGEATDTAGAEVLKLAAQITKQIDVTWASGDDAGGLSSSLTAPANNTWYHVHLIEVAGAIDVGFDTSVTATNLVSDHSATAYRRIGSVLTDGSANIIGFTQVGDEILWDVPVSDFDHTAHTTAQTATLQVPTGLKVWASIGFSGIDGAATAASYSLLTSLDQADTTPTATILDLLIDTGGSDSINKLVRTDTAATVRHHESTLTANIIIRGTTFGWIDPRGKDA